MRGKLSENAQRVIEWFGISQQSNAPRAPSEHRMHMRRFFQPGTITLITGASGAGKSTLLRALRESCRDGWIDLARIQLVEKRIVDCFPATQLQEILQTLAR